MTKKTLHILLAGMMLVLFALPAHGGPIGKMPQFSLPSALGGEVIRSEDFAGKVLLVTFFATWCPPCRQEIPTLIKLQNDYQASGFSVIGLSVDERGPKVVVKMIEKEKINYPVLMAKGKTTKDFGGVAGIPTSFLVNREGVIVKRYPGYVPHALLEKDLLEIL
ncbi:MAG: TlpA family protein disulfide reductase [Desulfobulbaceae bacterium]|nr:TlpA family protein disulfide reductase [Desulfobulbaceae bacterium]